jgi:ABC-type sugar transport system substrate-binding protein
MSMMRKLFRSTVLALGLLAAAPSLAQQATDARFTIAVIPDTQN